MAVKYRNGFPTKTYVREVLDDFWGNGYRPRISGAYEYTGSLVWENDSINERLQYFIDHLIYLGIEVESYRKYESPTCGNITFKKKK